MKLRSLLLAAVSALALSSCANVSIPVGSPASPDIYQAAAPAAPSAPAAMKLNLFGGDLENFQAVYPGGPSVAISGLKTSPGLGRVLDSVDGGVRWLGLGSIAKGFFKDKSNTTTQTALTDRAKISSSAATSQAKIAADAATRQAELHLVPATVAPAAAAALTPVP